MKNKYALVGNIAVASDKNANKFNKMFVDKVPKKGYKFLNTCVIVGSHGAIINWSAQGIGFGEFIMYIEDKKIKAETEGMSKEFCDALIKAVTKKLDKETKNKLMAKGVKTSINNYNKINSSFIRTMYNNITWE